MLKSEKLSVLEIAQIVGHTNSKMIIENYARYIKGEHLKISSSFNPLQINGDSRGDTKKTLSF
jgi:integrase